MTHIAFGLIDAQRGFMPAEEGQRLGVAGFGELPVADGARIVHPANLIMGAFARAGHEVFTTQDWHPAETAHFAAEPNYNTTWPTHCVADTPGAELHPELDVPATAGRFKKGTEPLTRGEDDTSYSGYNGRNGAGQTLGEWLRKRKVTEVVLGGLALDYCVRATALDLRTKAGLDVTVVANLTEPVTQATGVDAIRELIANGVRIETSDQIMQRLLATAA